MCHDNRFLDINVTYNVTQYKEILIYHECRWMLYVCPCVCRQASGVRVSCGQSALGSHSDEQPYNVRLGSLLSRDPSPLIAVHIQPHTTVHTSGSALVFRGENIPHHDSERGRCTAAAVEIFAEPIRENDPASSRVPSLPARATQWLGNWEGGRGVLSRWWPEFTSIERFRTYQPTLAASVPSEFQSKSNRSLGRFFRGLNARDFSRMLHRNASSTCYVTYGRLMLAVLQQGRSALRITFSLGHLTWTLSSRKTIESLTERQHWAIIMCLKSSV